MSVVGIVSIGFLLVMVALIVRGIRGHPSGRDGSDHYYQAPGPDDIIPGD